MNKAKIDKIKERALRPDYNGTQLSRGASINETLEMIDYIEKLKKKQTRIEVNTIFGKLFAEIAGDHHYPGIYLCFEEKDGKCNHAQGTIEQTLALAECTPNMPEEEKHTLRLLVWGDRDVEDYTHKFTFIEGNE